MRKFLKNLQSIQDECLENLRTRAEAISLGKVSGTVIRTADGIDFESWKKIRENIKNHLASQKRFRGDSGKVVLEKNFLLNSLKLEKGFFIFRPIDDNGKTYLQTNKVFLKMRPSEKSEWPMLLYLIPIACFFLAFWASPYFFIGLAFILPASWLDNKSGKRAEAREKEWLDCFNGEPAALLSESLYSFLKMTDEKCLQAHVDIKWKKSPFIDEYWKILNKTVDLACQVNGKIVWLWCYGQGEFEFLLGYERLCDYVPNGSLDIHVNILGSCLMPMIETESSFILCFDEFPEEMDRYGAGGTLQFLRVMIKDSLNGCYKDDMFKPVI